MVRFLSSITRIWQQMSSPCLLLLPGCYAEARALKFIAQPLMIVMVWSSFRPR